MYTTHYISIISYYSGYLVECLGGNMNREGHRVAVKLRVTAKNQTFSSGSILVSRLPISCQEYQRILT